MMHAFNDLPVGRHDPLLDQMAAFRNDPRENKLDLGIGIYRDDSGHTPVMAAVRDAETRLAKSDTSKVYEGPRGNLGFCDAVVDLVYGEKHPVCLEKRALAVTTVGGAGALHRAMSFAFQQVASDSLWVSDPTWPNHEVIAGALGFNIRRYHYTPNAEHRIDARATIKSLDGARAGDLVVLQGPCHNPTGCDLSPAAWCELADFVRGRGLLPLIDIAYHGFAANLKGVRAFLQTVPEALVVYSCSKCFGLYRERAGALIVQGSNAAHTQSAVAGVTASASSEYYMPPAHGPAVVLGILRDPELRLSWSRELNGMREALATRRHVFAKAMLAASGDPAFRRFEEENVMFSVLKFEKKALEQLRHDHAVYLPDTGRINIGALPVERAGDVAGLLSSVLS